MRRYRLTPLLFALAVTMSACSSIERAATDAANSATCAAAEKVGDGLLELGERAARGASVDELRRQARVLQVSADGVATAIGAFAPDVANALRQSGDAFQKALDAVPADAAGPALQSAVASAVEGYRLAIESARSSIGC